MYMHSRCMYILVRLGVVTHPLHAPEMVRGLCSVRRAQCWEVRKRERRGIMSAGAAGPVNAARRPVTVAGHPSRRAACAEGSGEVGERRAKAIDRGGLPFATRGVGVHVPGDYVHASPHSSQVCRCRPRPTTSSRRAWRGGEAV